ncbi:MAG TPA: hypothetical protein VGH91_04455 [Gammaproteobacteria bacterium]|jgi:hypothetical protein
MSAREFPSLTEFGLHLAEIAIAEDEFIHAGLDRAAALIEREAKREFGVYQPATGPFPAWPELADSTQQRREDMGYTPNDPLLASGATKETVSREVHGLDAVVGSTSDLMIYHEFGTSRMPARPVFGPAWFRNREAVGRLVAEGAVLGIIGLRSFGFAQHREAGQLPVHESLGYDSSVSAEDGNAGEE